MIWRYPLNVTMISDTCLQRKWPLVCRWWEIPVATFVAFESCIFCEPKIFSTTYKACLRSVQCFGYHRLPNGLCQIGVDVNTYPMFCLQYNNVTFGDLSLVHPNLAAITEVYFKVHWSSPEALVSFVTDGWRRACSVAICVIVESIDSVEPLKMSIRNDLFVTSEMMDAVVIFAYNLTCTYVYCRNSYLYHSLVQNCQSWQSDTSLFPKTSTLFLFFRTSFAEAMAGVLRRALVPAVQQLKTSFSQSTSVRVSFIPPMPTTIVVLQQQFLSHHC